MTTEYYVLEGGQKLGPFTSRELMDRPLEPGDTVLSPEQNDWKPAHDLPEFEDYFKLEGIYYPTSYNTAAYILRLPAYIIDCFVVVIPTLLLARIIYPQLIIDMQPALAPGASFQQLSKQFADNAIKYQTEFLIFQLVLLVIVILYNALCESSRLGASIGKYVCGLIVVDELGYSINFRQALMRNGGKLLYEAFSFLIGPFAYIAYLRMVWGELHQGIHDRFAGCFVVKKSR